MKKDYSSIQWVVQQNLTGRNDLAMLHAACVKAGIPYIAIDIIPFSEELPAFNTDRRSIFYGSTTFNNLVLANDNINEGLFMDNAAFSIENYLSRWGKHMLNYGAHVTTFEQLMTMDYAADKCLFIRPDDDSKSFSGEVKEFREISDWYGQLKMIDNINLSLNSSIVVSEPYNIRYEWRLWIINKKVVAASKYREYFKLKKEEGCPSEVIRFAEERCREYTPNDVFVMDVCLCGDDYFIVECGCMNAAGFYNANIEKIVLHVSDYFLEKAKP